MRFSGAAIALRLNALVAHADTRDLPPECSGWPEKPAREWTLEERIRHRLDPDCRFLYVAVAPGIESSALIVTSESLRFRGGECQGASGP